jgi:hypothetical protein
VTDLAGAGGRPSWKQDVPDTVSRPVAARNPPAGVQKSVKVGALKRLQDSPSRPASDADATGSACWVLACPIRWRHIPAFFSCNSVARQVGVRLHVGMAAEWKA